MLRKFEISNYLGFNESFVFDLSSNKRYDFNHNMVDNKIIKKALIFGPNGSCKSSLCSAIMDITYHLTDNKKSLNPFKCYSNYNSKFENTTFRYTFDFDGKIVIYEYAKTNPTTMVYEKLFFGDTVVLYYNFIELTCEVSITLGIGRINYRGLPRKMSILKYIYEQEKQNEDTIISKLIKYVSKMLYFNGGLDFNSFVGYKNNEKNISDVILRKNKVEEFRLFLKEHGSSYNLFEFNGLEGEKELAVKCDNGKKALFEKIASSGEKTLWRFYSWMQYFDDLSLLIIDDFDVNCYYESSIKLLTLLNKYDNLQVIVTTHNMMLMNNELTRPDCCFVLNNKYIKSLCQLTNKEIRQKNNLQKMYIDGEFSNKKKENSL